MADYPDSSTARCFGQRMLSPFRGVMHSVVTGWADAVTIDGRHWTLYVRGECLYDDPTELRGRAISVPDVKYGTWSERQGFQRAPIRLPTFDDRVRDEGETLLAAVRRHAAAVPFALTDRFELWLLHGESGLPLALIDSGCSAEDCEAPGRLDWTPGQACLAELPEAAALRRVIAQLAGRSPRAQWFERHRDGSGTAQQMQQDGARPPTPDRLPAAHFAPLFIDEGALTEDQTALLAALHRWQSPSLLQLPTLSGAQRTELEDAARRHALRLADQLPLYPQVIDRAAITAALVEARLRRSDTRGNEATGQGGPLSPDYIEVPDD